LSNFPYIFTLKELNEDCFKCEVGEYIINPMSKRNADEHMKRFGPGGMHTDPVSCIRNRLQAGDEDLEFASQVIMANVNNYTFGVRSIKMDDGTYVEVPSATCTKTYDHMLFIYKDAVQKAVTEGDAIHCIKDAYFETLFETLCSGDDKCLAR
jgi:hypothetical protein